MTLALGTPPPPTPRTASPHAVRGALAGLVLPLLLALGLVLVPSPTSAAGELSVATAVARQDGLVATVRGYVVGQPTATTTVVTSGFPNDYALALADSPSETDPADMLYVQVPTAFRSQWGLRSNPTLLGDRIYVTGTLSAYFSHPGLKSATSFAAAGSTPAPSPTPSPDPDDGNLDATYYASAVGKSGERLRDALHAIIDDHTALSYSAVWSALKATDEDPTNSNNVLLLYTGRSQSKSSNGGDPDEWNREQVWAKSHGGFGTATGPGTDLHHLRPTDGSQVGETPGNFVDGDSFEPRDAVKGDVARMVFYMAIRYEGDDGWPDLEVNDLVGNGSAPRLGRLSVLLDWNAQDPPSAFERRRNDVIQADYQGNRNPFIDHPEWANAIWN